MVSRFEQATDQQRAFNRVAGLPAHDHLFDMVSQARGVGDVGFDREMKLGREHAVAAIEADGGGEISDGALEHQQCCRQPVTVFEQDRLGMGDDRLEHTRGGQVLGPRVAQRDAFDQVSS